MIVEKLKEFFNSHYHHHHHHLVNENDNEIDDENSINYQIDYEAKAKNIFEELDKNGDGKIDMKELLDGIERGIIRIPSINTKNLESSKKKWAERIWKRLLIESQSANMINMSDFIKKIAARHQQIELMFHRFDISGDGQLNELEIRKAFKNIGINLKRNEVRHLIAHLDKSKTTTISLDEWNRYFQWNTESIDSLLGLWQRAVFVDFARDQSMPTEFTEDELEGGTWWRYMVAGAMAGAASRTITAPLDRIRIFQQVYGERNIVQTGRRLLKDAGLRSLWRGNFISVLKMMPESAIKFGTYEMVKQSIEDYLWTPLENDVTYINQNSHLSHPMKLGAGAFAGFLAQTTIYPLEVIKTRLALANKRDVREIVKEIYKNGGFRNFYRGYTINTLGVIPYAAVDFWSYETLREFYVKLVNDYERPPMHIILALGNISAVFGMYVAFPFYVIRTRKQSSFFYKNSIIDIMSNIYQKHGFRGFWLGSKANLFKILPAAIVGIFTFDFVAMNLGVER
ncbi:hypothetical protein SNEBB_010552 [Seison nebaliae]|nr:hypothetical protein SNEBB_010552 [Seison nebaliae]